MSVLQLLSKEAPGNKATPSLLHVHLATREARRGCSAEVFSLLHAAAACGLSRLCARFLAEGLDVNERTGHQHFSPLHLAASNGKVRATMTLLASGAFPWMLDQSGKTPLYHVVKSLPESSTAKQTMLLQICQLLVFGMLQASDEELPFVESALEILQQVQLSWLLRLHHRMRNIQNLNPGVFTPKILVELAQMHYENLNMFLSFFDGDEDFRDEPVEKLSLSRQRRWFRRSRATEQLMQEAEALAAAASKLPASEAKRSKRPRSKGRKKDRGLDLVVIHRSGALWPLDPDQQKAWSGTALDLDGEVFLPPQPA